MRLRISLILLAAFVLVSAAPQVVSQETADSAQAVENLRAQLLDTQYQATGLKVRLEQLDFDLKPENIERYFNGYGSTRPEEQRESRRRQLQTEKDHLVAQLELLRSRIARLETEINNAQVRAYQQSAAGAMVLHTDKTQGDHMVTFAWVLVGMIALIVVVSGLALLLIFRR